MSVVRRSTDLAASLFVGLATVTALTELVDPAGAGLTARLVAGLQAVPPTLLIVALSCGLWVASVALGEILDDQLGDRVTPSPGLNFNRAVDVMIPFVVAPFCLVGAVVVAQELGGAPVGGPFVELLSYVAGGALAVAAITLAWWPQDAALVARRAAWAREERRLLDERRRVLEEEQQQAARRQRQHAEQLAALAEARSALEQAAAELASIRAERDEIVAELAEFREEIRRSSAPRPAPLNQTSTHPPAPTPRPTMERGASHR